jgi:serine protease Do
VTTVPEPASNLAAEEDGAERELMLYQLQGGGEVVGELVKQTPDQVFLDIGPSIIGIPASSVMNSMPLSEMTKDSDSKAAQGMGVYDEETGSVVFRSRPGSGEILSQQQILDNVKRGVVVVSNPAGLGTGWLINSDGQLITNHHVIGNETYQTVTLFVKKGNQWQREKIDNCTVEAFSSLHDIALVQLNMDQVREKGIELHPVKIAETGALEAGDLVYAVGNPGMGRMVLEHTISEGIVSSLQRNFNDVIYLQTTAPVNPGNSGGPLVNQRGQVVGLITLKATFQEGVAFALPVEYIHHFLRHVKAYTVDDMNKNKGYRYHRPQ